MRWKLVLLLGLLATGAAAAALVHAQDGSGFGGSGLRSRPTLAAPADRPVQHQSSTRAGGLAERLQQIRQSVVDDYNTAGEAPPELLTPSPEGSEPAAMPEADASTYNPAGSALPSVLKRSTSGAESAPAFRSAAAEPAASTRVSAPAAPPTPFTASRSSSGPSSVSSRPAPAAPPQGIPAPVGARPLGSQPPGARPLGAPPAATAPATLNPATQAPETIAPLAPPTAIPEDQDVPISRRRTPPPAEPQALRDAPVARQAMQPQEPPPFRPASGSKELLVVGAAPQLRLETLGPKAAVRGQPTPYTMVISNVGDTAASGVQVRVESGPAVELAVGQASHGGAEVQRSPAGGAALVWTISELPRGAKAELTINAASQETRPFELVATWTCAPLTAAAQIAVLEPQLAMTLAGPKDIMFGDTKIYTITLTNPGTGDAENVMLSLAPLSSTESAPPPRNIGPLRAGERKEIAIQLTAREAGLLNIRAEASADGGLHAEAAEQVMVRRGEIAISVEAPPLKYAGSSAEYRVRVANVGNAAAEDLAVAVALPSGVEYVPGNDGGVVQGGHVAWKIGGLAPRDERTFLFTCTLKGEGEKRLTFQARAAGDLQATAAAATRVEALADLKLVVNDPPGPIPVGKEVVYEVRVLNRGTKAASGVAISGYFSEGIEPTGAEGLAGEFGSGQVTAVPIASLEAGAEIVFKIKAKADQAGNHIFRAVVECANPETRLAAEETTRFFSNVAAEPDPATEAPSVSEQPSPFQPRPR